MAIDMATLRAATYGDQTKKVEVKRAWLKEVHSELLKGQAAQRELAALRAQLDLERGSEEPAEQSHMDKVFGNGGKFEKIFGKRDGGFFGDI